jgi:hypothetical protein
LEEFAVLVKGERLVAYLHNLCHAGLAVIKAYDRTRGIAGRIGQLHLGKLSTKYEAGGKVRIFAIPTYFVQALLRPFHFSLFSLLKQLPTDCTFNQSGGWMDAVKAKGCEYWSSDLSAATDRLPLELQEIVLSELLYRAGYKRAESDRLAHLWKLLIRGET